MVVGLGISGSSGRLRLSQGIPAPAWMVCQSSCFKVPTSNKLSLSLSRSLARSLSCLLKHAARSLGKKEPPPLAHSATQSVRVQSAVRVLLVSAKLRGSG